MRTVAVFIGTRPEAIKMAPVIAALAGCPQFRPVVVNTGQHRELIDQVIELFGIRVDHDLKVMEPNQSLARLTANLISRIDDTLQAVAPDMVLVQGDTTTVLATSLAAFYRQIPIGHVEAGLRTGNMRSPFPEEANRKLTTPLADLHFAPTRESADNLACEGIAAGSVFVTGNPVIDALQMEIRRQKDAAVERGVHATLTAALGSEWLSRPYVLVTGHRRESFGGGFEQICAAILSLAKTYPDHLFIYPVHLNPNVRGIVYEQLGSSENIRLIEPVPYSQFVALLEHCRLVLSDSGGVQEEAPSLGKPVLVMRDTTERPEGIAAGTVKLVGADTEIIVQNVRRLLDNPAEYAQMASAINPYGDGKAAGRIVEAIESYFATKM